MDTKEFTEDKLIVGEKYFLDSAKDCTGIFLKCDDYCAYFIALDKNPYSSVGGEAVFSKINYDYIKAV